MSSLASRRKGGYSNREHTYASHMHLAQAARKLIIERRMRASLFDRARRWSFWADRRGQPRMCSMRVARIKIGPKRRRMPRIHNQSNVFHMWPKRTTHWRIHACCTYWH